MTRLIKLVTFAAYCLVDIFHGIILGAFGPVLLYFSKVTHQDETQFSFIFLARVIGFVAGASLAKVLQKHMSLHNLFIASIAFGGIALIVSSIDFGFWNLSITMFIIGGSCCIFQIVSTICIFELFLQEDEEFWLQLSSIFFGIGGLIGPFIALLTEELTLRAIGILLFMCITPLVMLRSPQVKNSEEEEDVLDKKLLQLPLLAELLLCLVIFINIGFIASVPNWVPTYAIKTGKFDNTQANLLASIFWISEILGKVCELLVRGSVQSKTYFLLKLIVLCSVITLVLQWFELYTICCYFGTISLGFLLSPLCTLFFTIAQQHGYRLSVSATANLTLASVIAEGMFVAPLGYLMGFFGFQALMYAFLILSLFMYVCFAYLNSFLEQNSEEKKGFLELES